MKYSIIIPHYNRPDLIVKTIESFKNLKDKEILIIDDVSTEENLNRLENNINKLNFKNEINLIKSNTKLYLPGARNKGLDLAKGDWIYFIDDDDEVTPKFVKWLNKNKQNKKYDFYRFPNIERLDEKNKMYIYKWWHEKYSAQVSTYLFNKQFLNDSKIKFNEEIHYGEDFELMIQIFDLEKIKSKYIHLFAFYYNKFTNIDSMIRNKEETPSKKLKAIDIILNSNYKDKESYALSFLVGDFFFSYKKNAYSNEKETFKIYNDFYKRIKPKFKNWWNIYLPWKINYFSMKKYLKKGRKKYKV